MPFVSESEERSIFAAKNKLDRIKEESKEVVTKAMGLGAAAAVGALFGVVNQKQGGTATAPFLVGGKAPLDAVLAGAGVIGALVLKSKHKGHPAMMGAASGALALYGARMGASWEAHRMSGGSAPAPAAGASVQGHGMHSRQFGAGMNRHRAAAAYVAANAR
jgi:hypothetical protein